jgi:hypothetical protein
MSPMRASIAPAKFLHGGLPFRRVVLGFSEAQWHIF